MEPKIRNVTPHPQHRPYSVLLLYPDYLADDFGHDTYYAHVMASDPASAVREAQQEAMAANTGPDDEPDADNADDFHPLLVLEGHHAPKYGD